MALSFELQLKPGSSGLLWALHQVKLAKATGVLEIKWEKFKKQILFVKGEPRSTKSNWMQESFGHFLVRRKRISETSLRLEIQKKKTEKEQLLLGEWLAKEGVIEITEIPNLLEGHFRERLFNLLHLTRGTVKFLNYEEGELTITDGGTLTEDYEKLMVDALRILFTEEVCKAKLLSFSHRKGRIVSDSPIKLAPKELRYWNQLMSSELQPGNLDKMGRWIIALASDLDLVEWGEAPENKMVAEYQAMAKQFEGKQAHEILKVKVEDGEGAAKRAYLDLVRRFHPDKLPKDTPADMQKMAEEVFSAINEAHNTLTDPERRKEYLAEIELEKIGGKEQVEKMLEAEMLIPQAQAALRRRHFGKAFEALKHIELTLKEDPEIIADRAYCELMVAIENKQDPKSIVGRVAQDIQKSIGIRSNYAPAYYYRGMMSKTMGRDKEAVSDFNRALAMDPNLTEAASELRLIQMREGKKKKGFFGR
jgi:DnaJ-domain-containing protein 1